MKVHGLGTPVLLAYGQGERRWLHKSKRDRMPSDIVQSLKYSLPVSYPKHRVGQHFLLPYTPLGWSWTWTSDFPPKPALNLYLRHIKFYSNCDSGEKL